MRWLNVIVISVLQEITATLEHFQIVDGFRC